ncbi:hypothetical protein O163_08215 [Caldanaerobacter subterraneus subsp. yonseiensis KB-1]|uniref:Helix-turn-helix domain-containing protein n=1 Tax=Caldanaerobacter subterraneus subsp. yonseiensis KB-1 TaxID=1388761 RepID=U5CV26_CALSX|nr:helix-turn-helix domain-containing protein [Caldanaerobacter subterraneus]ERM91922.1 hypothetical protein O163_08215 [Caldanaerobacter subterraneus subsp. yonseiensis KB-1]
MGTVKFINRTNKRKGNFTQISNDIINDKRLGLKEKAIIAYMLSKPDDWKFTITSIMEETGESRHIIVNVLQQLELYGYIIPKKTKNHLNQTIKQYIVKENPKDIVVLKDDVTIYRENKEKGNFTQVDNAIIYDKKISLSAKAVMIYMLSKPDTWRFYTTEIEESLVVNRRTLNKALKELEENGYLKREKFGRQYIWHVYEAPFIPEKEHKTQSIPTENYIINSENCQVVKISEETQQENRKKIENILSDLENNMQNVVNFGYSVLPQSRKYDDDMAWVYDISEEEIEYQRREMQKFWEQVEKMDRKKKEKQKQQENQNNDDDMSWVYDISEEEIKQQKE